MFQVTTPAARVPPAVADTNVVFAGIVSAITTSLALALVAFVTTVPSAGGLATCTPSCPDEDARAFSPPMFQVTTPAASVPPAVADTNVVFAGIVSAITTSLALALPVFENDSVYV